jgi:subtilisin family serine protease
MATVVDILDRQPPLGEEITVVAAAGNDGTDHVVYPAAFPSVTSVGAVDDLRGRASYSNFGPWVRASAQGKWVSSYFGGNRTVTIDGQKFRGYASWEGSSFAAPVVAARIATEIGGGQRARAAAATVLAQGTAVPGVGPLID